MKAKKLVGRPVVTLVAGAMAACVLIAACVCATVAGASSRSFPPPGRIVYSAPTPLARGFTLSLFSAATDGTRARQITSNALGADFEPRWSPDGTQVAFTRVAEDHLNSSVWVVNADGTKAHPVSGDPSHAGYPKWSPDGRLIAFQEQGPYGSHSGLADTGYTLSAVRPDGSGLRSLGVGAELDDSPGLVVLGNAWSWSPDSKHIAFVHTDGYEDPNPPTINILDLATGATRTLTTGTYPAWSPNGTRLAFVDRCRIWLIPAKGGKRTAITVRPRAGTCASDLAWSPDGRWIAATANDGFSPPKGGLSFIPLVARSDGTHQYRLWPIWASKVRWPLDCKRLFFYRTPNGPTPSGYLGLVGATVGWIVPDPRGRPRFARVPTNKILEANADWRCRH